MKITRKQLKRLIEGSIRKRGDDYVMPIEEPLTDPRDFDFDLSDENKDKLLALAGSDDAATRAQADNLADTLDFPSSGRFGADTLSTQMKMYDMDLDVLNDPDIDQLLDRAIELYFDRYGDSIAIDLEDVMNMGYVYKDFKTFLDGDPNFDDSDGGNADLPMLHIDAISNVMEKTAMLIGVKLMNLNYYNPNQSININLTKDFLNHEDIALSKQLSPEELNQLTNKLRKAAELFKRRTAEDDIPAVTQHVYDKMMKPMYKIYTSVIRNHPKGDFSKLKEGKTKITRRQLRQIIEASVTRKDGVVIPIEDPIEDPLKSIDLNPDQKDKLKTLALSSDHASRVQSDSLADMVDFKPSDRFGVDTFSDQVRLTEADLNNLMKVTELYNIIRDACDVWIYAYKDFLTSEAMNTEDYATYVEKVVATESVGENKSDIDEIKGEVYDIASKYLLRTGDENYRKIMDLFEPGEGSIRLIDELVYDILTAGGKLYFLYYDWRKYYLSGMNDIPYQKQSPELKASIANIKEGRR